MHDTADIEFFLSSPGPLFDVRSPGEFAHAHIPGAINLPLFSDEEREAVGIAYARAGRQRAFDLGLEFVGPRLADMVAQARSAGTLAGTAARTAGTELKPELPTSSGTELGRSPFETPPGTELSPESSSNSAVRVYCARGGMRSESVAWLLETAGLGPVIRLSSGYKGYRRAARSCFEQNRRLLVLGGMTGTGKTEILGEITRLGAKVVDLEHLANHSGSVFGHIGRGGQPTTEMFENALFEALRAIPPELPVWIEDESIGIGSVTIPKPFFDLMQVSPVFVIEADRTERARRLAAEYSVAGTEPIIEAIRRIAKRLGEDRAREAERAVREGRLEDAATAVLAYYDKAYRNSLARKVPGLVRYVPRGTSNSSGGAGTVLDAVPFAVSDAVLYKASPDAVSWAEAIYRAVNQGDYL